MLHGAEGYRLMMGAVDVAWTPGDGWLVRLEGGTGRDEHFDVLVGGEGSAVGRGPSGVEEWGRGPMATEEIEHLKVRVGAEEAGFAVLALTFERGVRRCFARLEPVEGGMVEWRGYILGVV